MRTALPALLVAVLLTTAGCTGGLGGSTPGDVATETPRTETPMGTATMNATPTNGGSELPPGLTTDGLTEPDTLVSAHADALEGQSVTLRERQVREYGDRDWHRNRTLRTAANRTRFLLRTVTDDRPVFGATEGRVVMFADGEYVYREVETPNSSWTDVLRGPNGDPEEPRIAAPDPVRSEDLRVVLTAFALNDFGNVWKSTTESGRYLVESSEVARPELLASLLDVDSVQNASLKLVVTSEGWVVNYRVEFVGTDRGVEVRGATTLAYSALGETAVEAPAWSEDLKERVEDDETTTG